MIKLPLLKISSEFCGREEIPPDIDTECLIEPSNASGQLLMVCPTVLQR